MATTLATLSFASLSFTANCTLSAQFEAFRNETGDVSVQSLVAFVWATAPSTVNLQGVTDGDIVDWYMPQHASNPDSANITASDACRNEYCKALRWEGDPDMAGIGVFISYLLESSIILILIPLLTLFYFLHDAVPGSLNRHKFRHHPTQLRVWIALNITLEHFWLAALLFAMGVTISALVYICISMSACTAAFSLSCNIVVWSVLLPWPFYSPTAPRQKLRKLVITALCLLNVVTNIIAFMISLDARSTFERLCFSLATDSTTRAGNWVTI